MFVQFPESPQQVLARVPLCENLLFVDNQTVWPLTAIHAGKTTHPKDEEKKKEGEEREQRGML